MLGFDLIFKAEIERARTHAAILSKIQGRSRASTHTLMFVFYLKFKAEIERARTLAGI